MATSRADPSRIAIIPLTVSPIVKIIPGFPAVPTGGLLQLAAAVTGTPVTDVDWSVVETNGGNIDANGRYVAPRSPGVFHIAATTKAIPRGKEIITLSVAATQPWARLYDSTGGAFHAIAATVETSAYAAWGTTMVGEGRLGAVEWQNGTTEPITWFSGTITKNGAVFLGMRFVNESERYSRMVLVSTGLDGTIDWQKEYQWEKTDNRQFLGADVGVSDGYYAVFFYGSENHILHYDVSGNLRSLVRLYAGPFRRASFVGPNIYLNGDNAIIKYNTETASVLFNRSMPSVKDVKGLPDGRSIAISDNKIIEFNDWGLPTGEYTFWGGVDVANYQLSTLAVDGNGSIFVAGDISYRRGRNNGRPLLWIAKFRDEVIEWQREFSGLSPLTNGSLSMIPLSNGGLLLSVPQTDLSTIQLALPPGGNIIFTADTPLTIFGGTLTLRKEPPPDYTYSDYQFGGTPYPIQATDAAYRFNNIQPVGSRLISK